MISEAGSGHERHLNVPNSDQVLDQDPAGYARPDQDMSGSLPEEVDVQREVEDALGSMSLMDMADGESPASPAANTGLQRGTVVGIQGDDILVDLGGKSTGVLPIKQLGEEPVPAIGSTIEVMVSSYNEAEGLLVLSRQDAVLAAAWDTLQVGQTVEGRVTGHNKGGLELKIDGIRAFMPISQIEQYRVDEDLSGYADRRLPCKVIEIRRKEKSVVVSRRAFLEEEASRNREQRLQALEVGQVVTGRIKNIMPYGAFVDIGGVDGLLHVGDMGYGRVNDPREVVQEGQELQVKILKFDPETKKIGLGLKQLMADPWTGADVKWPVDTVVRGRVTRLADFGAFVELEPGVEGLIPIGELTFERRVGHPREVVNPGDIVEVRILSVDTARGRISLSLKRAGEDPWIGASVRWPSEGMVDGTVKRITAFGAFVELAPGVEGLIHISEVSDGHVREVGDVLKVGATIQARVLSVDEERRRIALSLKQSSAAPDYDALEAMATSDRPERPDKPRRKKPLRGGLDR